MSIPVSNFISLIDKGQLISKCPFGVLKSPKKELRKRSNQKNKGTLEFSDFIPLI